jgi:ornithine cyclodeaminase
VKRVRLLFERDIRRLIDERTSLEAVERAFAALGRGQASLPGVINLEVPESGGEVHVKGAHLQGSPTYAVKVASGFPGNPAAGLPLGDGLMLAFSATTGALQAILFDNGFLTELRTGSAGALAARLLGRERIRRVGILGAGSQARYQLRALLLVRRPDEVLVFSHGGAPDYAAEMTPALGLPVRAVGSAREAVEGADLVITTTPARSPILLSEWVGPGTHITAMGSDGPDKNEIDPRLLARADRVVPDRLAQCLALGEIHHAVAAGLLAADRIGPELGVIAAGLAPGRQREDEITVADLTGVGIQDAAVAGLVAAEAERHSIGEVVDLPSSGT